MSELPAHSGERINWNGGLAGRHSAYFNSGILTETNVNVSASRNYGSPFLDVPSGSVRVNSPLPDGTNGLRVVSFGGNPFLATSSGERKRRRAQHAVAGSRADSKHRIKLTSELRRDGFTIDQTTNRTGLVLRSTRSATSRRVVRSRSRDSSSRGEISGSQYIAAVSLGDAWRKSSNLQIQYGVRLDANRFDRGPSENPAIERCSGSANSSRSEPRLRQSARSASPGRMVPLRRSRALTARFAVRGPWCAAVLACFRTRRRRRCWAGR